MDWGVSGCEYGTASFFEPLALYILQEEKWYHRVQRVATAAFWRTFSHECKISPGWWGWGCTPTPSHYIYHPQ